MAAFSVPFTSSGLNLEFISAEENEFLAKNSLVIITSGVNHDVFEFLSGHFGPLEAGLPCQVPLWFALQLRRNGKCIIEIPDWLTVGALQKCQEDEKSRGVLSPLPFYYVEIAQLLLTYAKDDFESPDQVRTILGDIQSIRMDRLRTGVLSLADTAKAGDIAKNVKLANISAAELLCLRGFVAESLSMFKKFMPREGAAGAATDNRYGGPAAAATMGTTHPLRRRRDRDDA